MKKSKDIQVKTISGSGVRISQSKELRIPIENYFIVEKSNYEKVTNLLLIASLIGVVYIIFV